MRAALRQAFAAWGRPARLRVDNGPPWGAANDLPPDLALWAIGLGIEVHWNRPRRCQENGKVERSHGVLAGWAEPATCASAAELQARLAEAGRLQREVYPAIRGRSRVAAHPALRAGGGPYEAAGEAAAWEERRVWAALAGRVWRRGVDKTGRISLYNRGVGVGRAHAGQEVAVRFDAEAVAWVIQDARGRELARRAAPELSRERILALEVSHRRPPRPRRRPRGKGCVPPPRGKPYAR